MSSGLPPGEGADNRLPCARDCAAEAGRWQPEVPAALDHATD